MYSENASKEKGEPNVRCGNWSVKFTVFTFSVFWVIERSKNQLGILM